LAVVGRVHPAAVITNAGARPGDFLVLSKPLGLGIITTAAKRDEDPRGAVREALTVMTTLNREASVVMAAAGAHAMTDITGFGLLGHLRNITAASGVSATIWNDLVPMLPAAREYVQAGVAPGGTHANRRFLSKWVDYDPDLAEWEQLLLCDAQTSGGLLAALPGTHAADVVRHLRYHGLHGASVIGSIDPESPGRIRVRRTPESPFETI
ncbi:MAG: selenide, water dikinase SelD, partial [Isosphaeraceae bacterium]